MSRGYLDFNATTPTDPEVLEEMLPFFTEIFANPSSPRSEGALKAQSAIRLAKKRIAETLTCEAHEITFTSGATESVNWVLKQFMKDSKNIYFSPLDHDATVACLKNYEKAYELSFRYIGEYNYEEIAKLSSSTPRGSLFTFILAHNELGTLLDPLPIDELKEHGHFIHLDATQAVGKLPLNFKELQCDFLSFSAHKVYGPKGSGGLIINSKTVTEMSPMIEGGGQQEGLRSGTLNVPGIVGLGKSVELAGQNLERNMTQYKKLREIFINKIEGLNYTLNAPLDKCLLNTLNITFKDWGSSLPLADQLKPFTVSQASACATGKLEARVLSLIGADASQTLRISFGKTTTEDEIVEFSGHLVEVINKTK
jgi:cysteine desulfurase